MSEERNIDKELEEQTNRFIDKYFESSIAYWNALLSVNAVLITVFSAVAIFGNANVLLVLLLILASMVSCWYLIMNFKHEKEGYKILGWMSGLPSPEERLKITTEFEAGPEYVEGNERIVEKLLFFQGALILLILFWGYLCPSH